MEPKPYGVEFKAYKYDTNKEEFYEMENFQLRNEEQKSVEPTKY